MPTVCVLLALNLAVYLGLLLRAGWAGGGPLPPGLLLRAGALYAPGVRRGQLWRVLTATVLHATPTHLVSNMLALACAGAIVVPLYGRASAVAIYLAGGFSGSLLSLAWRWHVADRPGEGGVAHAQGPFALWFAHSRRRLEVSVGASGAICGWIGAGAVRGYLMSGAHDTELGPAMLQWGLFMLACGVFAAADNAAHIGGMAGGALSGVLLAPAAVDHGRPWQGLGPESIVMIALTAAALWAAARSRDPSLRPESLLVQGDALATRGCIDDAVACYTRAAWLAPGDPAPHLRLAQAYLHIGAPAEAFDAASEATRRAPALPEGEQLADAALVQLGLMTSGATGLDAVAPTQRSRAAAGVMARVRAPRRGRVWRL